MNRERDTDRRGGGTGSYLWSGGAPLHWTRGLCTGKYLIVQSELCTLYGKVYCVPDSENCTVCLKVPGISNCTVNLIVKSVLYLQVPGSGNCIVYLQVPGSAKLSVYLQVPGSIT